MLKNYLFLICFTGIGISCSNSTAEHKSVSTDTMVAQNKPLFKDFMGINGHVTFKPDLYKQVCKLVRSYHNIPWDVKRPGDPFTFPMTVNQINWKKDVYGPWKSAGFETDICLQFMSFGAPAPGYQQRWSGREQWAYDYGKAAATYFGPSGKEKLCTSFEIGNEPGKRFDKPLYRTIFKQMAKGIRAGDPAAKIVTPAVTAGKEDNYSQGLNGMYADKDILPLYDVINLHTYATLEKSFGDDNTWNRSYPEDRSLQYLKIVDEAIAWRNSHAKDKQIWITEFGYDACTPEAMKQRKGWALKLNWQGATDLQQAQYLVRSFLAFAVRDVQRAYIYYYNDEDEASVHAASGLTRKFKPKMSFWAVKQLYQTLGEYRFRRVVKSEEGRLCVYEFVRGNDPRSVVWVAWSPTGVSTQDKEGYKPREVDATLDRLPALPESVTAMVTGSGPAPQVAWSRTGDHAIQLTIGESPVYIVMNAAAAEK